MGLVARYNWKEIKKCYIEGIVDDEGVLYYPVLQELADKFGPSMRSMVRHSSDGNWELERKIFQKRVEERRREKKTEVLADEASKFDSEVLTIASMALFQIKSIFETSLERTVESDTYMTLDYIERLARALKNYQTAGRLALGETTEKGDFSGDDTKTIRQQMLEKLNTIIDEGPKE